MDVVQRCHGALGYAYMIGGPTGCTSALAHFLQQFRIMKALRACPLRLVRGLYLIVLPVGVTLLPLLTSPLQAQVSACIAECYFLSSLPWFELVQWRSKDAPSPGAILGESETPSATPSAASSAGTFSKQLSRKRTFFTPSQGSQRSSLGSPRTSPIKRAPSLPRSPRVSVARHDRHTPPGLPLAPSPPAAFTPSARVAALARMLGEATQCLQAMVALSPITPAPLASALAWLPLASPPPVPSEAHFARLRFRVLSLTARCHTLAHNVSSVYCGASVCVRSY